MLLCRTIQAPHHHPCSPVIRTSCSRRCLASDRSNLAGKQSASVLLCRSYQAPAGPREPSQDNLLPQALAAEAAKQARRDGRQLLTGAGVQFKEVGVPSCKLRRVWTGCTRLHVTS